MTDHGVRQTFDVTLTPELLESLLTEGRVTVRRSEYQAVAIQLALSDDDRDEVDMLIAFGEAAVAGAISCSAAAATEAELRGNIE